MFVVFFIDLQLKSTYSDSVNVETASFSFSSAVSYPDAYESSGANTIYPNTGVGYSHGFIAYDALSKDS
jgi:hypothetical protein